MSYSKTSYTVLGVSSRTINEGVDLLLVSFLLREDRWGFEILKMHNQPYTEEWATRLQGLDRVSTSEILKANREFGSWIGDCITEFLTPEIFLPEFIAYQGYLYSHSSCVEMELGSGYAIADIANLPVIYDFAALDVIRGGTGLLLGTIGDRFLFPDYTLCLALEDWARISYEIQCGDLQIRTISPLYEILYHFSERGEESNSFSQKQGEIEKSLLEELNDVHYAQRPSNKDGASKWMEENVFSLIKTYALSKEDLEATLFEHVAMQIAQQMLDLSTKEILVTGKGVKHDILISRIRSHLQNRVTIAEAAVASFKDVLTLAFRGVLRQRREVNCLKSISGASKDSCSGVIIPYPDTNIS